MDTSDRRGFLVRATTWTMAGGLALSYGGCGVLAARYLYPARPRPLRWQFVVEAARMGSGDALAYRTPAGETVTVARGAADGTVEDFVALSSTCPHLGCQVHWEAQNARFFCPCHNGVFDPAGLPVSGPPAEAGQALPRHPLKLEGGLLFIQVPLEGLAQLVGPDRRVGKA